MSTLENRLAKLIKKYPGTGIKFYASSLETTIPRLKRALRDAGTDYQTVFNKAVSPDPLKYAKPKSIDLVYHPDDPKKWAVMAVFKGSRKQVVLARIGEGASDPRPEEIIKQSAEFTHRALLQLHDLYSTALRQKQETRS